MGEAPTVTVVIPALNEALKLPGILADLAQLECDHDVVVVDGDSRDTTCDVAREAGARVIAAARGRSTQLNAGAEEAPGEWLCFLHADVRMGKPARDALTAVVSDRHTQAAVWRFALDGPGTWFRIVEFGAWLRDRFGGLPYGDQGLLVRRKLFFEIGGFPRIPVMEDVALIRALKRRAPIKHLRAPLLVSARRWEREGPYCTWFRNIVLVTAYLAGVAPERLAHWYRSESG
ncbi:MAG: TIGR04283 family arsenosugar biosynthesis glycosyltransferase [Gemmatimonadales bacterium]